MVKRFMKKAWNRDDLIEVGFYVGLAIKMVSALVEFIGGLVMIILNNEWINSFIRSIATPELREDPKDVLMNHFITFSTQHSVAIYMLIHGMTKLIVIHLLWKKKVWAYPFAVIVFGLFIVYEIYKYLNSQSAILLPIIIIDIVIIIMIILEYKRLEASKLDKR